ncbi:MAG: septum formation initiator family protein [Chitinispirillaceae bacterium]|nr:septum formation initiator family protein [Chitinispirillaceae bacterium]
MKSLPWIAAGALVCGSIVFLFGKQGVYYPGSQLIRKNEEIEVKRRLIDSLQREIERLTNDTTYIERIAREKLGMARKDEHLFKFTGKGK